MEADPLNRPRRAAGVRPFLPRDDPGVPRADARGEGAPGGVARDPLPTKLVNGVANLGLRLKKQSVWADFGQTSLPLKTPICSAGGAHVLHSGRRAHQVGWPRLIFMWLVNSFLVRGYRSFTREWKAIR